MNVYDLNVFLSEVVQSDKGAKVCTLLWGFYKRYADGTKSVFQNPLVVFCLNPDSVKSCKEEKLEHR